MNSFANDLEQFYGKFLFLEECNAIQPRMLSCETFFEMKENCKNNFQEFVLLVWGFFKKLKFNFFQKFYTVAHACCVFRPANGCSAHCSLVEINFLPLKQLFAWFFALFYIKKYVLKGGLPEFMCYSLTNCSYSCREHNCRSIKYIVAGWRFD